MSLVEHAIELVISNNAKIYTEFLGLARTARKEAETCSRPLEEWSIRYTSLELLAATIKDRLHAHAEDGNVILDLLPHEAEEFITSVYVTAVNNVNFHALARFVMEMLATEDERVKSAREGV